MWDTLKIPVLKGADPGGLGLHRPGSVRPPSTSTIASPGGTGAPTWPGPELGLALTPVG